MSGKEIQKAGYDQETLLDRMYRLGKIEGLHYFASQEFDTIKSVAKHRINEYVRYCKGGADPRQHPDPVIKRIYAAQISRYSLGFLNTSEGLYPSASMLEFFLGWEQGARSVLENRKADRARMRKK